MSAKTLLSFDAAATAPCRLFVAFQLFNQIEVFGIAIGIVETVVLGIGGIISVKVPGGHPAVPVIHCDVLLFEPIGICVSAIIAHAVVLGLTGVRVPFGYMDPAALTDRAGGVLAQHDGAFLACSVELNLCQSLRWQQLNPFVPRRCKRKGHPYGCPRDRK